MQATEIYISGTLVSVRKYWFAFYIIIIIGFWGHSSFSINLDNFIFYTILITIFFVIWWLPWFIFNRLSLQRLTVICNILTIKPSRNSCMGSKDFDISNYKEILWEREFLPWASGTRSNLYLIDKHGHADPLTVWNHGLLYNINEKLIYDVSKICGLEIIRKSYDLDYNLKDRRELPID